MKSEMAMKQLTIDNMTKQIGELRGDFNE